jgi:hypothetical protein
MPKEIVDIIANSGGTVIVATISIYYIYKISNRFVASIDERDRKNTKLQLEFVKKLQVLTDTIKNLKTEVCDLREMLIKMYKKNKELVHERKKNP